MPTLLIATPDGGVVRRVPLDAAHAYWMGRSPRCDIALEPRSISRRHALLFPHAGSWWVADAGSTRGLRTADGPTRFAPLTVERWISVGPLALWLLPTTERARREPEPDPIGLGLAPDDPLNDSIDADAVGSSETEPSHLLSLEQAGVPSAGGTPTASRLYDLRDVQHATIGSDLACSIRLDGPDIAPLHAVVVREPRGWSIVAAQGAITSSHERYLRKRLESGVVVQLGATLRTETRLPSASPSDPSASGSPAAGTHSNGTAAGWSVRIVEPERLSPPTPSEREGSADIASPAAPKKPSTFFRADDAA